MIMEPILESLQLHPALLIVSGYESITSDDVRFLNAYRRHFDKRNLDKDKTELYGESDLALGGILNAHGAYIDHHRGNQIAALFATYPYLTIRDIWYQLYAPVLSDVFQRLLNETFRHLSAYSVAHKRPVSFFQPQTSVIRLLESSPCYSMIAALHMCGLGDKLGHAFGWVFERYALYEEKMQLSQRIARL